MTKIALGRMVEAARDLSITANSRFTTGRITDTKGSPCEVASIGAMGKTPLLQSVKSRYKSESVPVRFMGYPWGTSMKKLIVLVLTTLLAGIAFAHSGGTDSNGCHHNHKTGGYHCH